ncbi:MAG: hypothetical protein ABI441_13570, partial [Flavobacterium sp.]
MKLSFLAVVFLILSVSNTQAQEIVKSFSTNTFGGEELNSLKVDYGRNKTIPAVYETQILITLSYFPELKNT